MIVTDSCEKDISLPVHSLFITHTTDHVWLGLQRTASRRPSVCSIQPLAVHLLCPVGPLSIVLHQRYPGLAVGQTDRTQGEGQEATSETRSQHGQGSATQD